MNNSTSLKSDITLIGERLRTVIYYYRCEILQAQVST